MSRSRAISNSEWSDAEPCGIAYSQAEHSGGHQPEHDRKRKVPVQWFARGSLVRVESSAPYALGGDTNGDYWAWTPALGPLTISAIPYTLASAAGTAGPAASVSVNVVSTMLSTPTKYTLTVNSGSGTGSYTAGTSVAISANSPPAGQIFDRWMGATVANVYGTTTTLTMPSSNANVSATYKALTTAPALSVARLVLINADTNQPVPGYTQLTDGMTLSLSALPTRNLNIQAVTNPTTVGSVKFYAAGVPGRTETSAPYAMAGDTLGDYWPWVPVAGTMDITATPFTGANASGTMGQALNV